jgi:hypothetical protein
MARAAQTPGIFHPDKSKGAKPEQVEQELISEVDRDHAH